MSTNTHLAHGLTGEYTAPDWPSMTSAEVAGVLRYYPQVGALRRIVWHSPRPMSAAALIDAEQGRFFIKRHHHTVRSVTALEEEHGFSGHLHRRGLPVPEVLRAADGSSTVAMGEFVYEMHLPATGIDLHRDTLSWIPVGELGHARAAGEMLARLHNCAEGYSAPQRSTHILVARSELIRAADPVAALLAQLPERDGLAAYLQTRDWQHDIMEALAPWHARVRDGLAAQKPLWTHGDWHLSNLFWTGEGADARVSGVLDFGLSALNFALFDLATAIERNAIAWLSLDADAARPEMALALIDGYRESRPLSAAELGILADLLPMVHVDFALSEVEYYHAVTRSKTNADLAYDDFLRGHAAWFRTPAGTDLLDIIRNHD